MFHILFFSKPALHYLVESKANKPLVFAYSIV